MHKRCMAVRLYSKMSTYPNWTNQASLPRTKASSTNRLHLSSKTRQLFSSFLKLPTAFFPLPWPTSMWSSGDDNSTNNRHTSSSSSSSSRLSTPRRMAMEEVWKDISLTSLQDRPRRLEEEVSPKGSVRRMMLQEFLARPFREPSSVPDHPDMDIGPFGASPNPPPATVLSLNSSPELNYLDSTGLSSNPMRLQPPQCYGGSTTPSFMAASSPNNTFDAVGSSFCKKRTPEGLDTSGDRRHKRMIKNRESAARSRARKQAYTNELELEVAHLMEENGRLRKQQQQLLVAASAPAPTKCRLYRTSSAPF